MLKQLRSPKIKTVLWIGLAIFVIPSFVVFYGWGSGGKRNNVGLEAAATLELKNSGKVNVDKTLYENAKRLLRYETQRYLTTEMDGKDNSKEFSNQLIDYITSDRFSILEEAIRLALLDDFALGQGLRQDLAAAMAAVQKSLPQERQRLQFQQQLMQNNMSLGQYFNDVARGEFLGLAQQVLATKSRITVYEAWLDFINTNEKFVADVAHFNTSAYLPKVQEDTSATQEWFNENRDIFTIPDQVEYEYLIIQKHNLRKSIDPTDDEITSYYTTHKEDFRQPRLAKVRQIFMNAKTEDASEFDNSAAKLEEIRDFAAKGSDFSQLATSYTQQTIFPARDLKTEDDPSTAGGYLGYISEPIAKSFYGDEWTSAVFSMPASGGLTKVIKCKGGVALAKVEDVKEGVIQDLDKVRSIVRSRVVDINLEPKFKEEVDALKEAAKQNATLESLAKATSNTIETTDKVSKDEDNIKGIGYLGDLKESLQDLTKGGRSDVLEDKDRALVVQIKEEYPEHVPEFDEVKDKVITAWKQIKASELAKADAEKLFARSKSQDSFEKAAVDLGTTVTKTLEFNREEIASGLGGNIKDFDPHSRKFVKNQFYMDELLNETNAVEGYIVWSLDEIIKPTRSDFARELPRLSQDLSNRRSAIIMREFLRDKHVALEKEGKIRINEEYR